MREKNRKKYKQNANTQTNASLHIKNMARTIRRLFRCQFYVTQVSITIIIIIGPINSFFVLFCLFFSLQIEYLRTFAYTHPTFFIKFHRVCVCFLFTLIIFYRFFPLSRWLLDWCIAVSVCSSKNCSLRVAVCIKDPGINIIVFYGLKHGSDIILKCVHLALDSQCH